LNALKIHLDEDADAHALLNGLRHRGWDAILKPGAGTAAVLGRGAIGLGCRPRSRAVHLQCLRFLPLHTEFLRQGRRHAGIIIGDQQTASIGEEIRRLIKISEAKTAVEMNNSLEFLSNWGGKFDF
jgi:hypothetical protein